jgi:hypothetical protein
VFREFREPNAKCLGRVAQKQVKWMVGSLSRNSIR